MHTQTFNDETNDTMLSYLCHPTGHRRSPKCRLHYSVRWLSHVVARNVHAIHVAIMPYIYDVFIRCAHPYGVCLATAEEAEPCDMWDMLDKLLKRIPNPVR